MTRWDPTAWSALVWAKQILGERGVTAPPPPGHRHRSFADVDRTRTALAKHRLIPAAARTTAASAPDCPAGLQAWLDQERRTGTLQAMAHAAVSQRAQESLDRAGVPALFVKGMFQAGQSTDDYAFRGVGDVDILVPGDAFHDAIDALTAMGAVHEPSPGPPQWQERLVSVHHAATVIVGNTHIDLHRRLDPVPHLMRASFDEFWLRRDKVEIRGRSFPTLDPVDTCVFVASHGCQDNWPRLRHVVDMALALQLAVRASGWAAVWQRAVDLGVSRRLATAVEVTRLLVPELPPQDRRARVMAEWAWSRHRAGRDLEGDATPRNAMASFAYWTLSEGDPAAFGYAARRLMWLQSSMEHSRLPERLWWAYPLLMPVNVAGRIVRRSREQR